VPPPNLTYLILKLNPHIYTPPMLHPTSTDAAKHINSIDLAIKLCTGLLKLDATRRLTAASALEHEFFLEDDSTGCEEHINEVIPGGEGKCGNLHGLVGGKGGSFYLQGSNLTGRRRDYLSRTRPQNITVWTRYTTKP
jgi:cell division control protein 7